MVVYPPGWADLELPNFRFDLLRFLDGCRNAEHFENAWEVDFDIHFFFDDTRLAEAPFELIGAMLFNAEEAQAIQSFTQTFEAVLDSDAPADWTAVIAEARKAYPLLAQAGVPLVVSS